MKKENLSKKELEQLCIQENIILERHDPLTNSSFYLPNMEKIGIMIRDFDFLVEGASRGRAINEISKIEIELHANEGNPDFQSNLLATRYSDASFFIESKKNLINDKKSENWNYMFTKYFPLADIYYYFHKSEGASSFFRRFQIYSEMVELNYYLKLMEYLRSQVELLIPIDDDRDIPMIMDSLELKLLIFHKSGFLATLKEKMNEYYFEFGAKLLTTLIGLPSSNWKQIHHLLVELDADSEDSISNDTRYTAKLKDLLYHYKLDLR